MTIAFTVFAVAGIAAIAIAHLTWGAILVGREINHEEKAWH
jgi:hypothetical protein